MGIAKRSHHVVVELGPRTPMVETVSSTTSSSVHSSSRVKNALASFLISNSGSVQSKGGESRYSVAKSGIGAFRGSLMGNPTATDLESCASTCGGSSISTTSTTTKHEKKSPMSLKKPGREKASHQLQQECNPQQQQRRLQRRRFRRWGHECWNLVVSCSAVASFASSLAAMYLVQTTMIYIAFSFPLVTSAMLLIQQIRNQNVPSLRQTIQTVREDLQHLSNANQVFSTELNRLEKEHGKLKQVKTTLEQSVKRQGGDMREMTKLLREYGLIQRQMKRLTAAAELQQIMRIMLHADANHDFLYTEQEFDQILRRLRTFSVVDKNRLQSVFRKASKKSFNRLYQSATQDYENDYAAAAATAMDTTDLLILGGGCSAGLRQTDDDNRDDHHSQLPTSDPTIANTAACCTIELGNCCHFSGQKDPTKNKTTTTTESSAFDYRPCK